MPVSLLFGLLVAAGSIATTSLVIWGTCSRSNRSRANQSICQRELGLSSSSRPHNSCSPIRVPSCFATVAA